METAEELGKRLVAVGPEMSTFPVHRREFGSLPPPRKARPISYISGGWTRLVWGSDATRPNWISKICAEAYFPTYPRLLLSMDLPSGLPTYEDMVE